MKIAILEPLGVSENVVESMRASLLAADVELVYFNTPPTSDEEKIQRGQGADILVLANMPLRKNVLEACPDAKMISVAFTGVDHVDMAYCQERGIMVCNCSGYANEAVSELVMGMAISLYRKLGACDEATRSGKTRVGLLGLEMSGKTFGIVGAGAIGLKTAALAKAFGCNVIAYSRTPKTVDGITFMSLEDVMQQADIISLHVPLTADTKGLIDAKLIGMMKENAILINTARGPVVDSQALADALTKGAIAGAAIDVFEVEPPIPSEQPLLHAPNVIVAPHVGFATKEALEKRAVIAFENIKQWMAGTPQNVMK